MANPTALTNRPAVLVASAVESTVNLLGNRAYTFAHDGEDTDGNPDTNTIYLSVSADVDADESEGADKFKLISGRAVDFPKGLTTVKFSTEIGSPTFSVVAR